MSLLTETGNVESVKCDELEARHSELDGKQVSSAVVDVEERLIIEYNLWVERVPNECVLVSRCYGNTRRLPIKRASQLATLPKPNPQLPCLSLSPSPRPGK